MFVFAPFALYLFYLLRAIFFALILANKSELNFEMKQKLNHE